MKLTEKTVEILKNFASINPSILLEPGQRIHTISPQKTIYASANIEEDIPTKACIYELGKFLTILGLYKEPDVEFNDTHFIISEGRSATKYMFADPLMIITPPSQPLNLPESDVVVSIDLDNKDIAAVMRASGVLQTKEVAFEAIEGEVFLKAYKSTEPNANSFRVKVGETQSSDFNFILKVENLRILPGDYKVAISKKSICRFIGTDATYFVAIEAKSTFPQ